jgi:lipoprotein-anchoring transpeptidase ErfK/SrfK
MQRLVVCALLASAFAAVPAYAEPVSLRSDPQSMPSARMTVPVYAEPVGDEPAAEAVPAVRLAYAEQRPAMGGGFIEFLFGDLAGRPGAAPRQVPQRMARGEPVEQSTAAHPPIDPRYEKQTVPYTGPHKPGTVVIDTRERFLYLVQDGGTAMRYGIGVGRPGFAWAGMKEITAKREWPDWRPPDEMLQRRPDLPRFMPGGPDNPLGARAMYLGSSLYRIHGSNEPWTIGQAVSSGCIRMRNEDVVDLYERVRVGTKVLVI